MIYGMERRLWILEDQNDLRSIMEFFAESSGYLVQSFANLDQAWTALKEMEPRPALCPKVIISDFHLPDGTSEHWILTIKNYFPAVRVICVSAHIDDEAAQRLQQAGVPVFEKPESLKKLLELFE
jgi:two-component system nitrogen regulation response regulator GlnG